MSAAIKSTIAAENLEGTLDAAGIAHGIVLGRIGMIMGQSRTLALASFETLISAIRSMKKVNGRKMAVFVSDGFPVLENELSSKILDVVDAATRSGVVIYSIDARGLYAMAPGGGFAFGNNSFDSSTTSTIQSIEHNGYEAAKDVMNSLSRDTGGFPVFNTNDMQAGLKKTLDDNNSYYVMAYYTTSTENNGKFRQIKVAVKSHPEFTIEPRKGYYAAGRKEVLPADYIEAAKAAAKIAIESTPPVPVEENEKKPDPKADKAVSESLGSPVPSTDLGVKLSLNYIDVPSKGGFAFLDLLVDPRNLQFGKTDVSELDRRRRRRAKETASLDDVPGEAKKIDKDERYASILDVYVIAFGSDGKVAANFKKSVQMKLYQNTYDFVNSNGVFYRDTLNLKPGLYQIRLAGQTERKRTYRDGKRVDRDTRSVPKEACSEQHFHQTSASSGSG